MIPERGFSRTEEGQTLLSVKWKSGVRAPARSKQALFTRAFKLEGFLYTPKEPLKAGVSVAVLNGWENGKRTSGDI